jgi:hypothetical protein
MLCRGADVPEPPCRCQALMGSPRALSKAIVMQDLMRVDVKLLKMLLLKIFV